MLDEQLTPSVWILYSAGVDKYVLTPLTAPGVAPNSEVAIRST